MSNTNFNSKIKLVCPNPKCINKSPTFRRFDALKDYACKACGVSLERFVSSVAKRADLKAKRELGRYQ